MTALKEMAAVHNNQANVLLRQHKLDEAISRYREALRLDPNFAEAYHGLGNALERQNRLDEAMLCYQRGLRLKPLLAEGYNNLANVLTRRNQLDEAISNYREALRLDPDYVDAHYNLGTTLLSHGRPHLAVASFRQALHLRPDLTQAQDNLLFCSNYDPDSDPDEIFAEYRRWGQRQVPKTPPLPHANDPDPGRRLRIGYVSPDLRLHALTRYFEPVLAHHDPSNVEVFCYAGVARPDIVTIRLQKLVHEWRWTVRLTDEQIAKQIRDDRIDILVDLAGHTGTNRLGIFALKPAPVQVTWLGYLNTTGLSSVDYRLTDEVLDPLGQPIRDTEELWRLPEGMCCFARPLDAPDVAPLPALRRGYLTFGSLQHLFKLNGRVYDLWSQVLKALPTSRLIMYRDTITDAAKEHIFQQFRQRGVDTQRLDVRQGRCTVGYLGIYNEMDVTLDAFPATGGVTTCESLWMGVPVLSLCGVRPMARNSAALLARVGLGEWAVDSPEHFVALAMRQEKELEKLAQLRSGLRDSMVATLCDAERFTKALEGAYRAMWRRWCTARAS